MASTLQPKNMSVDDVAHLLQKLGLGKLEPAFRENAITGSDLLEYDDDTLKSELGMTNLQLKKLRGAIQPSVGATAGPTPSADTTPSRDNVAAAQPDLIRLDTIKDTGSSATPAGWVSFDNAVPAGTVPAPAAAPAPVAVPAPVPVPVAAPAPAPARAPVPATAGRILAPELLRDYRDNYAIIQMLETDKVESQYRDADRGFTKATSDLQATTARLHKLERTIAEETENQSKKKEGWHLGKHLGGPADKHYKEKVAELEASLATHKREAQAAREAIPGLERAVKQYESTRTALSPQVEQLNAKRAANKQLHDAMFLKCNDTEVQRLLADMNVLYATADQARARAKSCHNAAGLLDKANQQVAAAHQELERAFGIAGLNAVGSVFQVRHDTFRAEMENMMEMRAVQQANELTKAAAVQVEQARRILPELPYVQADDVGQLDGMFGAIMFNNVFSDMRVRQSIAENIQRLEQFQGTLQQATAWAREIVRSSKASVADSETRYAALRHTYDSATEAILARETAALGA